MRPVLWLGFAAVVLLGAAGHPVLTTREWTRPADPDADRVRQLEARQQGVLRRIADKEAAVAALLRGELTLPAAAGRFREADAGDPAALQWLRARNPGASDEEMYSRQVISFLRARGRPASAGALAERLEAGLAGRRPETPRPSDDTWRLVRTGKEGKGTRPAMKGGSNGPPGRHGR